MKLTTLFLLVAVCLLLATSPALAAGNADAGKQLYTTKCRACHGADGNPNPAMAKKGVHPLSGPEVQGMSDAELAKKIKETASHKALVKTLTDADVDNLVAFIRTLKK